ncbi:glycoside hydrolase family 43 protein [Alteromonas gilva]|uniref:Family 43 glycosylhydrolase n=1 Tax=Alteromonas gilva TaxID=2987522 RepID=A0ABT5L5I7_9ALTE|nr:glycoside hydrolase family 43 protein [Alteromonas gilva]MDC8832304.1 family 43 glycosylhydrolase [Alteromonas gilva]
MKQRVIFSSIVAGLCLLGCQSQSELPLYNESDKSQVTFDWFEYSTPNNRPAAPPGEFANPVLPGFYPDPSITKKGDNYYLTTSSFSYTPGLPILRSSNLTDWTLIGYALDREDQMQFAGAGISRGIFAPTIRYHDGLFYIITTSVDNGGNFIITASDPTGPWSEPVWLPEVGGIDPDIFFDDDGRVYITHNEAPPGEPLYDGHRAIWMWEYDPETQKVLPDSRQLLVNGGVDLSKQPIWIEAPHIYKINGWYYLSCAEGGTGPQHSQVVFRSRSLDKPFVPYENNPILTQRDLSYPRPNPVDTAGHADFIQTDAGEWWAVFLGTRPYANYLYNTGRDTFLLPVEWRNEWPHILPPETPIAPTIKRPAGTQKQPGTDFYDWSDSFDGNALSLRWQAPREFDRRWASIENGALTLSPLANPLYSRAKVSYLGTHQAAASFAASTELTMAADSTTTAGLAAFQSADYHYFLGLRPVNGRYQAFVEQVVDGQVSVVAEQNLAVALGQPVTIKIHGEGAAIEFAVKQGDDWLAIGEPQDATWLSTQKAGGFVGTTIGMHARQ